MSRKNPYKTLEAVAECAGITLRELKLLAANEPRLAALLEGMPDGECPSGMPLRPEELDEISRLELRHFSEDANEEDF